MTMVDDEVAQRKAAAQSGQLKNKSRGGETVLLVEDDTAVRAATRQALERQGYQVLEAPTAAAAFDFAAVHKGAIQLLLTDVVMADMPGRSLADRIRTLRPETRVLYMSGYSEEMIERHGVFENGASFIAKPFSAVSLGEVVRGVLDRKA